MYGLILRFTKTCLFLYQLGFTAGKKQVRTVDDRGQVAPYYKHSSLSLKSDSMSKSVFVFGEFLTVKFSSKKL